MQSIFGERERPQLMRLSRDGTLRTGVSPRFHPQAVPPHEPYIVANYAASGKLTVDRLHERVVSLHERATAGQRKIREINKLTLIGERERAVQTARSSGPAGLAVQP